MGLCRDPWLVPQALLLRKTVNYLSPKWDFNSRFVSQASLSTKQQGCISVLNQDAMRCNCPAAASAETQHKFLLCELKHISVHYISGSLSLTHTHLYRYICPLKSAFSSSMKSELISETVILCSDCCERCLALRFEKSEASFFSRKADGILVNDRVRSCDKKAVFLCHYLKVLIFSLPENCHTNWGEKIMNIYFRKLFVWNTRPSWPRCNLK